MIEYKVDRDGAGPNYMVREYTNGLAGKVYVCCLDQETAVKVSKALGDAYETGYKNNTGCFHRLVAQSPTLELMGESLKAASKIYIKNDESSIIKVVAKHLLDWADQGAQVVTDA
jgi:hypothetical protein